MLNMSCKINSINISKLLTSLTEFLDSNYRGQLYNITSFNVKAGCSEFDNFLSSIYKISLSVQVLPTQSLALGGGEGKDVVRNSIEHHFNFICKSTILEDDKYKDNLEKYYWNILFTKEKLVYDFLQTLSQELGSEVWPLCPKMHHYYAEGEDYSCLILDDLVSMGYYMPKTVDEGLSLEECNLIMKSLARLHALSLGETKSLSQNNQPKLQSH